MSSHAPAKALFALLVAATFAAFFVTQRLKHAPTVLQRVMATPYFSPHSVNHHSIARISFRIKRADQISVSIVAPNGDDVATLTQDRHLNAYRQISFDWSGRTDSGRQAPDGTYRMRVRLRDEGRSIVLPRTFVLHATPPTPRVLRVSPSILPAQQPATITWDAGRGSGQPQLSVVRTDLPTPRTVATLPVAAGSNRTVWDGTAHGRKVGPGTYIVQIRVVDREGNVGQTPATLPPPPGQVVPGHAGITVRYLGVEPPAGATLAGGSLTVGVDARRQSYSWSVTHLGAARPRLHGSSNAPLLHLQAPRGISGMYQLGVQGGSHAIQVPLPVQGPGLQHVLVVLPEITWLGQDAVDDDGDGIANTLDQGLPVRTQRVYGGSGLPAGFSDRIAPLLQFLDRQHLRYDLTSDLQLAQHHGVPLRGHSGLLLAGDERWLPDNLQRDLRSFVRRGGQLASFGVDSLRRSVSVNGSLLSRPGAPADTDVFGARLDPLSSLNGPVTNFLDKLGLFGGGGGQFSGYSRAEPTQSVGPSAQLLSSAVTGAGRPVVTAVRYGRGTVIRTGLPELPGRLSGDPSARALVQAIWAQLSR